MSINLIRNNTVYFKVQYRIEEELLYLLEILEKYNCSTYCSDWEKTEGTIYFSIDYETIDKMLTFYNYLGIALLELLLLNTNHSKYLYNILYLNPDISEIINDPFILDHKSPEIEEYIKNKPTFLISFADKFDKGFNRRYTRENTIK